MKKSIYIAVALIFVITISKAQIPNAGFENWTSMGTYNNPDSWGTLNNMTTSMSTYTCVKGTPGSPGASYIKLTSKTVTGMGVLPGIAVSGTFDQSTFEPLTGFAFNQRPANLTGSWQHMIFGSSQGYIDIQLTRWDANSQMRIPVAYAHNVLTGMAMSWASFTIPLVYVDGNNPDSCIITLSASGSTPTNNDYLYVDNLAFTGTVAAINDLKSAEAINTFPNPVDNQLTVDLSAFKNLKIDLQISDIQGKNVKTINGIAPNEKTLVNLSDLVKGDYFLSIITDEGSITKKFIKQ